MRSLFVLTVVLALSACAKKEETVQSVVETAPVVATPTPEVVAGTPTVTETPTTSVVPVTATPTGTVDGTSVPSAVSK